MKQPMNRRAFLQSAGAITAGVGLMSITKPVLADNAAKGAPHAEKLGWRLGCQAWTFNDTTFFDAIDKTASLGLHYIEAFPGQKLSAAKPKVQMGDKLSAEDRKEVKQRLSDNGVKVVSFGVGGYSRAIFEFAKDMGLENIVSEPPFDAFDQIDKLCEEHQINVALHNHARPSRYWDPDIVLRACKDHSKRIGACCDIGHWLRSNINPVEALKKLEGRIIEFHFKDLNHYGKEVKDIHRDAFDVPWGTGKSDVKAILIEVKRQGVKGLFNVEYEHNYGKSLPEIAQSVAYFDKIAEELGG
jgi:sugar phosphate isomerase/epimerase